MKNFVVGFLDFFDNELRLEKVQANNEVEALRKSKFMEGYELPENGSVEDIQNAMFNCDASVSVIEV